MHLDVPQIIAHRAGLAYAPENSLSALEKCLSLSCHYIEFDVRLTACGTPIVFHDETLKRLAGNKAKISNSQWQEIKDSDIGSTFSKKFKGEKILTLTEMIHFLMEHNMNANIELKPGTNDTYELVTNTLAQVMQHWSLNDGLPLISSFDTKALALSQTIAPEMARGLLLEEWDNDWKKDADDLACASVHLSSKIVTESRIKAIHDAGRKVLVYTVNKQKKAKRLLEMGVDGLFSDYPDLLTTKTGWFFSKSA